MVLALAVVVECIVLPENPPKLPLRHYHALWSESNAPPNKRTPSPQAIQKRGGEFIVNTETAKENVQRNPSMRINGRNGPLIRLACIWKNYLCRH